MIALDTNVLVRVITRDDPAQARVAAAILRDADFFVSKTVIAEVARVLNRSYLFERPAIAHAVRTLLGIENGVFEDRAVVLQALTWFEAGVDLSDALHLAAAANASIFATFDQRFARTATRLGTTPGVELLRSSGADVVSEAIGRRYRAASKRVKARTARRAVPR